MPQNSTTIRTKVYLTRRRHCNFFPFLGFLFLWSTNSSRVYGFSQIEEHFSPFFTDRTLVGARMMGRGAAGGAHVDGLESIEWNPAGLARGENFLFSAQGSLQRQDASGGDPFRLTNTFNSGFTNFVPSRFENFFFSPDFLAVGYGKKLGDFAFFGAFSTALLFDGRREEIQPPLFGLGERRLSQSGGVYHVSLGAAAGWKSLLYLGAAWHVLTYGALEGVLREAGQADVRFAKLFEKGKSLDFGLQVHPASFLWLGFSVRGASRGRFHFSDTLTPGFFQDFLFPGSVRFSGTVSHGSWDFSYDSEFQKTSEWNAIEKKNFFGFTPSAPFPVEYSDTVHHHFGVEYQRSVFSEETVAFRAGGFFGKEGFHLRQESFQEDTSSFPPADRRGVSVGLGVSWNHFQLDAAWTYEEREFLFRESERRFRLNVVYSAKSFFENAKALH